MATQETRERILSAAEQCFGDLGFSATTMRDITAAAGVNLASVNYHFGSKEALFHAVVDRALRVVREQRALRLEALHERDVEPSLEELIDVIIGPVLAISDPATERGRSVARLLARGLTEPASDLQEAAVDVMRGETETIAELRLRLPGVGPDELLCRLRSMVGAVLVHQLDLPLPGLDSIHPVGTDEPSTEQRQRWVARFIAGGLTADPAG